MYPIIGGIAELIEHGSMNFNKRFGNEKDCCQVCFMGFDRQFIRMSNMSYFKTAL